MTERVDTAVVEVNGVELSRWVGYKIESDLLTPADAFWLQVDVPVNDVERVRDLVSVGAEVQVYIDRMQASGFRRALQMTGWIDRRSMKVTRDGGLILTVEGRDKAGVLCDASVDPALRVEMDLLVGRVLELSTDGATATMVENRTRTGVAFIDLVRAAVQPWGLQVIADDSTLRSVLTGERVSRSRTAILRREARAEGVPPTLYSRNRRDAAREAGVPLDEYLGVQADSGARFANGLAPSDIERLKVSEARPRVGETVWDYLDRHARRLGLMMWMTADGRLVVGAPDYGQEPLYRLIRRVRPNPEDPNTIIEGGTEESIAKRYSSVTVYGRGGGNDATRAQAQAVTIDPDWTFGFEKPLYVKDNGARDGAAVLARGERELAMGKDGALQLSYVVDGHGQRDLLWAQGTVAYVEDERLDIRGNFFVVGRTFELSRANGTSTSLRLVPRHSIVL